MSATTTRSAAPIADYSTYRTDRPTWGSDWLTADDARAAERTAHAHPACHASPARAAVVADILRRRAARKRRRARAIQDLAKVAALVALAWLAVGLSWLSITFADVAFGHIGH